MCELMTVISWPGCIITFTVLVTAVMGEFCVPVEYV